MSMDKAKKRMSMLLSDESLKVVALSGKWGTGKSEMWDQIRKSSNSSSTLKRALYVSIFGIASIRELKLKLAEAAISFLEQKGARVDSVKQLLSVVKNGIERFFKLGSSIDELLLVGVPALIKDKLIVIDDIERKHEKLTIDEILGFLDDITRNYSCRILLILNSDELADKSVWEKLREKVIEAEVRLTTTPQEAFAIAHKNVPSKFHSEVGKAIQICGVTNIRIIQKIIKIVNEVLGKYQPLSPKVLERMVPSTVLLSAIYYQGIENGPSISYVLDFNISERMGAIRRSDGSGANEENASSVEWASLLHKLRIVSPDEYEITLADYLSSGLIDETKLEAIVGQYKLSDRNASARLKLQSFYEVNWDLDLSVDDIVEKASHLLEDVPYIDPQSVTLLHAYLVKIPGGAKVADMLLTSWISAFEVKSEEQKSEYAYKPGSEHLLEKFHPAIQEILKEQHRLSEQPPMSLLDTCLYLDKGSGWGDREESVLRSATVDDFERTILGAKGSSLKDFMLKNVSMYARRENYHEHFGSAHDNFFKACQKIAAERAGTRWAEMIHDVFGNANLKLTSNPDGAENT
ncbi:hypothetical protein RJO15_00015 [Herbaspirillum huttiense F1]|jgi:hypothetical protein|uniref:hypothetical protein n=1 Tax=Herbaspirillum huttiense TaxID=863372 RepID=UPI002886A25D|nr:hypothetical protein [Herbaspirillum huttiense]MDT0354142.1 hypothetical protein [Herbaspirillum huttiense F1]